MNPLFADDSSKILAIGHSQSDVQIDIGAIDSWVRTNHMELAIDKCSALKIRGTEKEFHLAGKPLKTDSEVKDLGITVGINGSWTAHINDRLKKANRVCFSIRRNVAFKVNTLIKLGLYKSVILPILLYGLNCLTLAKCDFQSLEKICPGRPKVQKFFLIYICGSRSIYGINGNSWYVLENLSGRLLVRSKIFIKEQTSYSC